MDTVTVAQRCLCRIPAGLYDPSFQHRTMTTINHAHFPKCKPSLGIVSLPREFPRYSQITFPHYCGMRHLLFFSSPSLGASGFFLILKALRSQLENENFLKLIIFLIGEQSNSPPGEYACFLNEKKPRAFI